MNKEDTEKVKNAIFYAVEESLDLIGYCCEVCGKVRKMIYTRKSPRTCLGYIDILSDKNMPIITIEHYPNDINWTLKKELIDLLNTRFPLQNLGTTEIPCGMSNRFREKFEILGYKNFRKDTDHER